ncbi:MAG: N-acetylmuramic acid 6-phosphate etherase [Flavobacteriales bacterium]|jgi:N-acetylmuramic acid 6-phosphate etherase|nr:N-acetylmuramic acid 6-phosphate etherase [Flavobacteriales bacterium]MBK7942274.1 N-acetylmuramic acid 6-phosphate etherase [Flavobacteriales bacterium]MBK9699324.1 N-acetylmuramic acid 6-phosphate etherase [Flavobacteriales bacterium]
MEKITESPSPYSDLERMGTTELLGHINAEDRLVPEAVGRVLPEIAKLVEAIAERMRRGGRLFYLGAGTSGRLGIVDASECPPTFGVPHGLVVGLIAGGDRAIRKAVEFAEDDREQGWKDLEEHAIGPDDAVVGVAASGGTPYVVGALEACRRHGILTACITCNPGAPVTTVSDHPIVVVVGPEFVTGSTRMKSGTAQKLVLNMISTAVMIRLGRVKGNRMVDMQLSNVKLIDRGTRLVMEGLNIGYDEANALLKQHGSVRRAIDSGRT